MDKCKASESAMKLNMGTPREFKEGDIVGSREHTHNDCGDVNRDDEDSGKTGQW